MASRRTVRRNSWSSIGSEGEEEEDEGNIRHVPSSERVHLLQGRSNTTLPTRRESVPENYVGKGGAFAGEIGSRSRISLSGQCPWFSFRGINGSRRLWAVVRATAVVVSSLIAIFFVISIREIVRENAVLHIPSQSLLTSSTSAGGSSSSSSSSSRAFEENEACVAVFAPACVASTGNACAALGSGGFMFGLATAPAHVEDRLDDSWIAFAQHPASLLSLQQSEDKLQQQQQQQNQSRVKGWETTSIPEERLRFWTSPEVEIDLAAATGIDSFRLGVDWGRIVPSRPVNGTLEVVDWAAVKRYKDILRMLKTRNLRVMLTLFHHSFPKWGLGYGGWTARESVAYFAEFALLAAEQFGDMVDVWVTFNEPQIFVMMTHCWGSWPPGVRPTFLRSALCGTWSGTFGTAMRNVADAHRAAYAVLKTRSRAPIGVAHSVGFVTPFSVVDLGSKYFENSVMLFRWIDSIVDKLDFCGLNYYGQEFLSVVGLQLVEEEEYSEAGRAVYPDGLYRLLLAFHDRYKTNHPNLRYIITENGIADDDDIIRRPYLTEHLVALHEAMRQGVPVDGYFHWTVSDNWEWADGYCPKFGLVHVDREDDLKRRPRPSYHLYTNIVKSRCVTGLQREEAWQELQKQVQAAGTRPFCQAPDAAGRLGSGSLGAPVKRRISDKDWRFGHYRHADILAMVARFGVVLRGYFVNIFGARA